MRCSQERGGSQDARRASEVGQAMSAVGAGDRAPDWIGAKRLREAMARGVGSE